MGIFDLFKKSTKADRMENYPEMLTAKLLFFEKPVVDITKIREELKKYFDQVEMSGDDKVLLFIFPNVKVELEDTSIPAQCTIFMPNDDNSSAEIPPDALQQNWHWEQAGEVAQKCEYEFLISDLMTTNLDYKHRAELFMNFLVAVAKATNPQAIYSAPAQKLIDPNSLIQNWDSQESAILFAVINVRLFKITSSNEGNILMDTVGLSYLGLPDFQVLFIPSFENEIAKLLWNYAYYIFDHGDVIETGHTLLGLDPHSKWKCERQVSLVKPERVVINVQP
jgi:hypothetical protein